MGHQTGGIFEALNGNVYGNMSSNQTLILSHGFGLTQSVWQLVIPFLAYYFNFKVVVIDLAFSPNVCPTLYDPKKTSNYNGYVDDLLGVVDQLKIDKAIYIGHSMSAMIGCVVAVKRPQLFEHLILLGGSPRYLNDQDYNGGFKKSDIDAILEAISQNYTNWVQSLAPKAIGVNDSIASSTLENSLLKMNPSISLDVAKTVFLSDLRSILPEVRVRTTIVQSKIDFVVPKKVACYMKKHLGGHTKLKILKTQGHVPQLTCPFLLVKVLRRVLKVE